MHRLLFLSLSFLSLISATVLSFVDRALGAMFDTLAAKPSPRPTAFASVGECHSAPGTITSALYFSNRHEAAVSRLSADRNI